jgi:hypothetical protein
LTVQPQALGAWLVPACSVNPNSKISTQHWPLVNVCKSQAKTPAAGALRLTMTTPSTTRLRRGGQRLMAEAEESNAR